MLMGIVTSRIWTGHSRNVRVPSSDCGRVVPMFASGAAGAWEVVRIRETADWGIRGAATS